MEMGENFNPEELVCGGCSDIAKAQVKTNSYSFSKYLEHFFSSHRCVQNMAWISSSTNVGTAVRSLFSFALEPLISATRAMMTSRDLPTFPRSNFQNVQQVQKRRSS